MSVIARSVGNALRNKVRTAAVVAVLAVLAVAIGLALAMLVANQAVAAKVADLNASVGTVLTVNPAGGQGFEGGGEPLTAEQAATAATVPNVTAVVGTKALRLRNAAAAAQTGAGGPGSSRAPWPPLWAKAAAARARCYPSWAPSTSPPAGTCWSTA
ncbi:hypothetical protein ABIB51_001571 [Arthrobacter sp. UYCu712]